MHLFNPVTLLCTLFTFVPISLLFAFIQYQCRFVKPRSFLTLHIYSYYKYIIYYDGHPTIIV